MGTGGVRTPLSTRWGMLGWGGAGVGAGASRPGAKGRRAERRHSRGAGNDGGVKRGITGAVLRHRMLPFLISERF